MKALVIREGRLELAERPGPRRGSREIKIKVEASGINRADLLQARGLYPPPAGVDPDIPGLEVAGVVVETPSQRPRFPVGTKVMAILPGEGHAQEVVVHERAAIPLPDEMSWTEAAAIPEAFLTAFDALFLQATLEAGERVLIHAVGSGVGLAALQLASFAGAWAAGTTRTTKKLTLCQELGLALGVDTSSGFGSDEVEAIRDATGGRGVDVVLDFVGGAYLDNNLKVLSPGGRLITLGLLGGVKAPLNLGRMMQKRLKIMGSTLRSRPLEEKITLAQEAAHRLMDAFSVGRLMPIVEQVYPPAEINQALARLKENDTCGKLIIDWSAMR